MNPPFFNKMISARLGIFIVVLAALLAGGIAVWQYLATVNEAVKMPETGMPIVQDETVDWQTYRNEEYGFEVRYPENIAENFPQVTVNKIESETYSGIRIGEFEQGCTLHIEKLPSSSSDPSDVDYVASDMRKGKDSTLFFGMRAASRAVDPEDCQILLTQILSTFRFLPPR